jgi:hypothetical protein
MADCQPGYHCQQIGSEKREIMEVAKGKKKKREGLRVRLLRVRGEILVCTFF